MYSTSRKFFRRKELYVITERNERKSYDGFKHKDESVDDDVYFLFFEYFKFIEVIFYPSLKILAMW